MEPCTYLVGILQQLLHSVICIISLMTIQPLLFGTFATTLLLSIRIVDAGVFVADFPTSYHHHSTLPISLILSFPELHFAR